MAASSLLFATYFIMDNADFSDTVYKYRQDLVGEIDVYGLSDYTLMRRDLAFWILPRHSPLWNTDCTNL